jgi:hypothetical protein
MSTTDLSDKMRAYAKSHDAPELKEKADAFDAAASGYYSVPPTVTTKGFLGAWARARQAWCDVTGDPLV